MFSQPINYFLMKILNISEQIFCELFFLDDKIFFVQGSSLLQKNIYNYLLN